MNSLYRALDLHGVASGVGLVAYYIHLVGVFKAVDLVLLYIHRDIYQHGTFTSRRGNVERLLENARQILSFAHEVAVLDERLARAGDVRLLEHISAQQVAFDLTRDSDHGYRVRICGGDARDKVCGAGARGRDTNARKSAAARITARRVRRVLLLTHEHVLN